MNDWVLAAIAFALSLAAFHYAGKAIARVTGRARGGMVSVISQFDGPAIKLGDGRRTMSRRCLATRCSRLLMSLECVNKNAARFEPGGVAH